MKLNQQNRKQNDPKQKPKNSGNQNQSQPNPKNADNNPSEQNSQKPAGKQQELPKQQMGTISKEEAQQILDAFQSRELEEQRKLRERRAGQRSNERDW